MSIGRPYITVFRVEQSAVTRGAAAKPMTRLTVPGDHGSSVESARQIVLIKSFRRDYSD
jgi:hypothetical protein